MGHPNTKKLNVDDVNLLKSWWIVVGSNLATSPEKRSNRGAFRVGHHAIAALTNTSVGGFNPSQHLASWWLNQSIWKICPSNWIISPGIGVKIIKSSVSHHLVFHWGCQVDFGEIFWHIKSGERCRKDSMKGEASSVLFDMNQNAVSETHQKDYQSEQKRRLKQKSLQFCLPSDCCSWDLHLLPHECWVQLLYQSGG